MQARPIPTHGWGSGRHVYVDNIRDAFVAQDPGNASTYEANAEAYKA
ncbi:MAG: hypothetical protein R3C69_14355 [Geminicoccaceae bacterium]